MPYKPEELEANEHYQGLKTRDELKYVNSFSEIRNAFELNGGKFFDGLRVKGDKLLLYEDPTTGETISSETQKPRYIIYQKRYRTSADTKDILDREFTEF
tara:strand:- start:104 stop:403 length:300 start_codon:yes stop_codon:yes gene_type:complete